MAATQRMRCQMLEPGASSSAAIANAGTASSAMNLVWMARPTSSPASHGRRCSTTSAAASSPAAVTSPSTSTGVWMGDGSGSAAYASGTAAATSPTQRPPRRRPTNHRLPSSSIQPSSPTSLPASTGSMPSAMSAAIGSITTGPVEMRTSNGVIVLPESVPSLE